MKRTCVVFLTILISIFSLTVSAQKMDKWEKEQLKEKKKELREYEELDKKNAKEDKDALASLQKGITTPFVARLYFYFVRDAKWYGNGGGTGYNRRDEKNWGTANRLIDAAKAIPGAYTVQLERTTDSILLERTSFSLMFSQSFDSFPANNVVSTLKYLRNKDYSPEVNIRLANLYLAGMNIYPVNGYNAKENKNTWVQSFDSAYKFIYDAAVAGNTRAMDMLGYFKIQGDGSIFNKPSPSTYKYLDTISAGIWFKKQFDVLYANKPTLTHEDSLNSYMLYKIAYEPGDIDTKGIECYKNSDHKKAYRYWLASAKFRNSAYAIYRIGFLYLKGEGGLLQHTPIALDYFEQAGKMGYAPAYYAAGLASDFGSAKRGDFLGKATAMGYKPASDALTKDNMRIDEMNRISMEKTRSRNFYIPMDDDEDGDTNSLKKGNTSTKSGARTNTCSGCHGTGQIHTTIPGGAKKNGVTIFGEYRTCSSCNGKGYY